MNRGQRDRGEELRDQRMNSDGSVWFHRRGIPMHVPEAPAPLILRLFGPLEARLHGAPMEGLHLREGERLLAYLVLSGGAGVPYRELAERFWPAEARTAFGASGDFQNTRQAVRSLRVALGDQAFRLGGGGRSMVAFDASGADVALWRELMGVQARRRRLVQMEETFESLRERRSETGAEPEAETVALLARLRETAVGTKSAPAMPAVVATSRAPSGGRRRKVVI